MTKIVLIVFIYLFAPAVAFASLEETCREEVCFWMIEDACYNGYSECTYECEEVSEVYDYDSGEYLYNVETDAEEQCEEACERGRDACLSSY
jgi:hypothetical protein